MKFRKYLNMVLPAIIVFEWIRMVLYGAGSVLGTSGLSSLKFFTILSNLLEAFACIIWLVNKNEKIKYVATVSVMLTFTVVMVFLGPTIGYRFMFMGANLWFHLLVPLIALVETLFFTNNRFDIKDNLYATIPMGIYGIFYLGNILINGIGTWPKTNDWYGFMVWGIPFGFVIYFVILFVTFLLGLIIRTLINVMNRQ